MKIKLIETDINGNDAKKFNYFTKEELEEYEALFCECHYLEQHPNSNAEYVEKYNGVNHGWICPKCKKFTQIG